MTSYRENVEEFGSWMLDRLWDNDHKLHWTKCSKSYLLARLHRKAAQLTYAVLAREDEGAPEEDLWELAADLANYAMMVVDDTPDGSVEPQGQVVLDIGKNLHEGCIVMHAVDPEAKSKLQKIAPKYGEMSDVWPDRIPWDAHLNVSPCYRRVDIVRRLKTAVEEMGRTCIVKEE